MQMEHTLTFSIQDYLKNIYELTDNGKPATTTALAERLGIAPASVTGMVQKLSTAKPPLLKYRKHQGVTLTNEGQRAAMPQRNFSVIIMLNLFTNSSI